MASWLASSLEEKQRSATRRPFSFSGTRTPYFIFIIPSGLSIGLQNYCRNDNAPGLVSMVVVVTTICNILGGWLLIYPLKMGTKGAAIATGVSQTIGLLILLTRFSR